MYLQLSSSYSLGRPSEAKLEQPYLSQSSDVLRFRVSFYTCEASLRQVGLATAHNTLNYSKLTTTQLPSPQGKMHRRRVQALQELRLCRSDVHLQCNTSEEGPQGQQSKSPLRTAREPEAVTARSRRTVRLNQPFYITSSVCADSRVALARAR